MKVKIRGAWYDSDHEPICLQVSEVEQTQIGQMDRSVATKGKYAIFPDHLSMTREEMFEAME